MAKIMIVEDEAVIRQLIGEELTKWRFDVYQTTDFNQVFEEFEQVAPQLVLLDINLPVYDGYFWCQKFVKYLRYRSFLSLREIRTWIKSWQ